jgi:hypothetical protein
VGRALVRSDAPREGRQRGSSHLALGALVVVWPLAAWFVVGLRRPPAPERWRPFAWAAVAATVLAVAALLGAAVWFRLGGTSAAMQALGGQLVAVVCLLGALISGAIAGVLRTSPGDGEPPHP